jgi:hypothetical protein
MQGYLIALLTERKEEMSICSYSEVQILGSLIAIHIFFDNSPWT